MFHRHPDTNIVHITLRQNLVIKFYHSTAIEGVCGPWMHWLPFGYAVLSFALQQFQQVLSHCIGAQHQLDTYFSLHFLLCYIPKGCCQRYEMHHSFPLQKAYGCSRTCTEMQTAAADRHPTAWPTLSNRYQVVNDVLQRFLLVPVLVSCPYTAVHAQVRAVARACSDVCASVHFRA